jgi:hypothetical protein
MQLIDEYGFVCPALTIHREFTRDRSRKRDKLSEDSDEVPMKGSNDQLRDFIDAIPTLAVQKSTRTTFPRRPAGVNGGELSHPFAPLKDGISPSIDNWSAVRAMSFPNAPKRAAMIPMLAVPRKWRRSNIVSHLMNARTSCAI